MNTSVYQNDFDSLVATSSSSLARSALNKLKKSSQSAPIRGLKKIPSFAVSPGGPEKVLSDNDVLDIWVDDGTSGNLDDGTRLWRFTRAASNIDSLFASQPPVSSGLERNPQDTACVLRSQKIQVHLRGEAEKMEILRQPPLPDDEPITPCTAPSSNSVHHQKHGAHPKELSVMNEANFEEPSAACSEDLVFKRQSFRTMCEPVTPPTAHSRESPLVHSHSKSLADEPGSNPENDLTSPADTMNVSDRKKRPLLNLFKRKSNHVRRSETENQAQEYPASVRFIKKRRSQLAQLIKKLSSDGDIRNVELQQERGAQNNSSSVQSTIPDITSPQITNNQAETFQPLPEVPRSGGNHPQILHFLKKLSSGPKQWPGERTKGAGKEGKTGRSRNFGQVSPHSQLHEQEERVDDVPSGLGHQEDTPEVDVTAESECQNDVNASPLPQTENQGRLRLVTKKIKSFLYKFVF